jgi:hypothetical protein
VSDVQTVAGLVYRKDEKVRVNSKETINTIDFVFSFHNLGLSLSLFSAFHGLVWLWAGEKIWVAAGE